MERCVPKLLGQHIGLGCVVRERALKKVRALIHLCIRSMCAYWRGDVDVWAFTNKARCGAFGCNYKLFFTWYALHIAFHSFVPTIFFSPFLPFSMHRYFSTIENWYAVCYSRGLHVVLMVLDGMVCLCFMHCEPILSSRQLFYAFVFECVSMCSLLWLWFTLYETNIIFSAVENHIPWHYSLLLQPSYGSSSKEVLLLAFGVWCWNTQYINECCRRFTLYFS